MSHAPAVSPPSARLSILSQSALALAAALALYLATERWPDTPDGLFHLQRVRALSEALRAGVLLPRWFPDFSFGYGYPVFNFYAPAFYYPPALLHLVGFTIIDATRLTLALIFALSGLAMVRLARLWTSLPAALLAGVAYLASSYRLYDLFLRGALPEFAAFLWLPLLAWACVRLYPPAGKPDLSSAPSSGTRGETGTGVITAALVWAGLLLTHNLTALMAFIAALLIALVVGLWNLRQGNRRALWRGILLNGAAFGLGVLLSAWYVVPALLEARWVAVGAQKLRGYQAHFLTATTLFTGRVPFRYPLPADRAIMAPILQGVAIVAAGALAFRTRTVRLRLALVASSVTLLFALWMTTQESMVAWLALEPLLSRLQFPFRWQTIAAPAFALLLALIVEAITQERPQRWAWAIMLTCTLILVIDATGALDWQAAPFSGQPITRRQMLDFDAQHGQVGATWTGEFLPVWVNEQRWAIGREPPDVPPPAFPSSALDIRLRQITYLGATYDVAANAPASITFQTFHYPAWRVLLNGTSLPTRATTALGLLTVDLPAGAHTLAIAWGATPAVWLGRTLAFAGWGVVLALLWRKRGYGEIGAWIAVAMVGLIAATGAGERVQTAQDAQADFGPVQLAGVIAPLVRAGADADIALHWLVQEQSGDLTTFVHLLNPQGEIVAQQDGPLAGPFSPASRWQPGLLIDVTHSITLPPDITPGRYGLRIGLYPPGEPDQPLLSEESNTPFILAGTLEVRP